MLKNFALNIRKKNFRKIFFILKMLAPGPPDSPLRHCERSRACVCNLLPAFSATFHVIFFGGEINRSAQTRRGVDDTFTGEIRNPGQN